MKKIAVLALLLAGVIGWAVRDEANSKLSAAPTARDVFLQKVKDNAALRASLKKTYPDAWRSLAQQTRHDLGTCVVTELLPGVLKADCR